VAQLERAQLDAAVAKDIGWLQALNPQLPSHQASSAASFDPHGSLGLYLFGGSASFREVRIEELPSD
jgi:hypothetical protein